MAQGLAVYEVSVNGHLAHLKLTAADAESMGARPLVAPAAEKPAKKAPAARNKARTATNKTD